MTTRTASLALALALAATAASAQDYAAMNSAFDKDLNAAMNGALNQIITTNVNDPRIQAMYWEALQTGRFNGSIEEFAYAYAYTGGFSAAGYDNAINTNTRLANEHNDMMRDYWDNHHVYTDAYNGWTAGHAANAWEGGVQIQGQSTYNGNWGPQQLPHTWQPGYYDYNGNSYYVDGTGQYYQADPSGSGYYYPMW